MNELDLTGGNISHEPWLFSMTQQRNDIKFVDPVFKPSLFRALQHLSLLASRPCLLTIPIHTTPSLSYGLL